MEFGAFVNFLGKQDGLVHISELAAKRVEKVGDVVKEGDEVSVKVVGFDRGKVKLSMKQATVLRNIFRIRHTYFIITSINVMNFASYTSS